MEFARDILIDALQSLKWYRARTAGHMHVARPPYLTASAAQRILQTAMGHGLTDDVGDAAQEEWLEELLTARDS